MTNLIWQFSPAKIIAKRAFFLYNKSNQTKTLKIRGFIKEVKNTMMGQHKGPHMITFLLVIIGGLNWLLLGIIQWEIGDLFGGQSALISRIIYILVGLAAVYELAMHKQNCRKCTEGKTTSTPTPSQPPSTM